MHRVDPERQTAELAATKGRGRAITDRGTSASSRRRFTREGRALQSTNQQFRDIVRVERAGFSGSGVVEGVCFSCSFHRAMTALLVLLWDGRGYA